MSSLLLSLRSASLLRRGGPSFRRITRTARLQSSNSSGSSHKNVKDHEAHLREANAQMQKYHEARLLMQQGKLKSKNPGPENPTLMQGGIFACFLVAFFSMPFLGKKIAQDDEFRKKWVPHKFDYTVEKPTGWTREELHEQMLESQRILRERAIAGDFEPDKLDALKNRLPGRGDSNVDRSKIPAAWDKIHPGLDDDENLDESDD